MNLEATPLFLFIVYILFLLLVVAFTLCVNHVFTTGRRYFYQEHVDRAEPDHILPYTSHSGSDSGYSSGDERSEEIIGYGATSNSAPTYQSYASPSWDLESITAL
ncbi:hypothetical protein M426DRAFT_8773 [Hypoxylon sp. CI-4A]|nr:hypothetical protein M426DRAFT_8773 [Hypoxylon sp. CI-4A]